MSSDIQHLLHLIPSDDLHWDGFDEKWSSMSDLELQELLERILPFYTPSDEDNDAAIVDVVNWALNVRAQSLLLKQVLDGRLIPVPFQDGEVHFVTRAAAEGLNGTA